MTEKAKILIIEDSENLAKVMRVSLEAENFSVITSHNGEEGLKIACEEKPDLIILDRMMRGLSGDVVISELKKNSQTSDIPVIMMTGRGAESDKIEGLKMGADHYMVKPYDRYRLLKQIEILLEKNKNGA